MAITAPTQFTFANLLELYRGWDGDGKPYEHLAEIMLEAKKLHQAAWYARTDGQGDHGQSWKSWKGNNFERLIRQMVSDIVTTVGDETGMSLYVTTDTKLNGKHLSPELDQVKRRLVVNFGEYGMHVPDADIVIYQASPVRVVATVSCKTSLAERVAQTAYWKLKLASCDETSHIIASFVTTDEKRVLKGRSGNRGANKGYAIVSSDIDATYVLRTDFEITDRIKHFSSFESDLRSWLGGGG